MKSKKSTKPYSQMTAKELAKATSRFDEEFIIDRSVEQNADQKAQWRRAKSKRGRPTVGKGVQVISVSIEKDLLKKTDRLAKKLHLRRTQLIARGLKAVLDGKVSF
jgi:predicted transcriptional regulator